MYNVIQGYKPNTLTLPLIFATLKGYNQNLYLNVVVTRESVRFEHNRSKLKLGIRF